MVFSLVPPAISSLGNASGFDLRLQDRGGVGQATLMQSAQQLLQLANESPILTDTRITGLSAGPQLKITVDRDKAAALGVSFNEVSTMLGTALGSSYVAKFPTQGRMQNVWVQAEADHRMTIDNVMSLNVKNSEGGMVPMSALITAEWDQGPVYTQPDSRGVGLLRY